MTPDEKLVSLDINFDEDYTPDPPRLVVVSPNTVGCDEAELLENCSAHEFGDDRLLSELLHVFEQSILDHWLVQAFPGDADEETLEELTDTYDSVCTKYLVADEPHIELTRRLVQVSDGHRFSKVFWSMFKENEDESDEAFMDRYYDVYEEIEVTPSAIHGLVGEELNTYGVNMMVAIHHFQMVPEYMSEAYANQYGLTAETEEQQ